ncbi:MAG: hypothetical protein KDB22_18065, partial [Planctomycetales bacterium]|nr:hypothetical protein [Planctomycetales bacterium]
MNFLLRRIWFSDEDFATVLYLRLLRSRAAHVRMETRTEGNADTARRIDGTGNSGESHYRGMIRHSLRSLRKETGKETRTQPAEYSPQNRWNNQYCARLNSSHKRQSLMMP